MPPKRGIQVRFLSAGPVQQSRQYLATINPAQATDVNPFGQRMELVADPRLDVISTTAWCLAAIAVAIDTISYAYLEEQQGPMIEARDGSNVDGLEVKCRLDFGAGVLEWRGLYENLGA